jgi:hypothetical protein
MRFYLTAEWRQQTGQRKGPLGLPKGLVRGGAVGTLASAVASQCRQHHKDNAQGPKQQPDECLEQFPHGSKGLVPLWLGAGATGDGSQSGNESVVFTGQWSRL